MSIAVVIKEASVRIVTFFVQIWINMYLKAYIIYLLNSNYFFISIELMALVIFTKY